jgi:hypothetical protein
MILMISVQLVYDDDGVPIGYEYIVAYEDGEPVDLADIAETCFPLAGIDENEDGFNDGDLDTDASLDLDETWLFMCTHGATEDDAEDEGTPAERLERTLANEPNNRREEKTGSAGDDGNSDPADETGLTGGDSGDLLSGSDPPVG